MTNLETALDTISKIESDEMSAVIGAIKDRQTAIARKAVRSFVVGDRVKFKTRDGEVQGEITKVNRKNLVVKNLFGNSSFRVPAGLCKPTIGIGG